MKLTILPTALAVLSTATVAHAAGQPKNSALLRNIKSLTVYKDRMTSHRRVSAIPQLKCIGGSGKGHYEIDVMRCTNSGSSYDEDNVDWTCKATLPPEFKLGSTDVICEGYSSPDDPYILKGSCGVEYRLALTELGEEKYGSQGWFKSKPAKGRQQDYKTGPGTDEPASEKFFNFIFWCLFIGVGLWIGFLFLKSIFAPEPGNGRGRGGRRPGGGGGGGGTDDDNDPPPPYDPRPPKQTYYTKPRSSARTTASSSRSSEQWRPGFWTGAATGAAAAYAAGRAGGGRAEEQARRQEQSWFGRGWGGGGGNAYTNAGAGRSFYGGDNAGEGPSRSYGSSGSPSGERYESTGFGSTRRR